MPHRDARKHIIPAMLLLATSILLLRAPTPLFADDTQGAAGPMPADDARVGMAIGKPHELSADFPIGGRFMQVTHHGSLELDNTQLGEFGAEGLSALAFDTDEQTLYALSDFGALLHLLPEFDGDTLKGVRLVGSYRLTDERGEALDGDSDDAEGLALQEADDGIAGNTRVLVSFEGRTRVWAYSPQGKFSESVPLPAALDDPARFPDRNQGLEALALMPDGNIVSGPQRPFKDSDTQKLHLYAAPERHWYFAPIDTEHASLVALEDLPDGRLLLLERRYISFVQPVLFALRMVDPTSAPDGGDLPVTDLALFDSSKGWRIDNFEGIARHVGNRFFMVSDDNASFIQKTLLVYLSVDLE